MQNDKEPNQELMNDWNQLSCVALVSASVSAPRDLVPFAGSEPLPTLEHCLVQIQPVNNKDVITTQSQATAEFVSSQTKSLV